MNRHHLAFALRSFARNRGYTALNLVGLSVGLACCLLLLLFVRDELQYDRYNTRLDRLYRLVSWNSGYGQPTNANSAFSIGPALENDFPEIEHAVRLVKPGFNQKRVVERGDFRAYEEGIFYADSTVFDAFSFPFLEGNPQMALTRPFTLVLSRSAAAKYFPNEDAFGQELNIDANNDGTFTPFSVTGVIENVPRTSHISFDFLLSFSSQEGRTEGWGWDPVWTYALLREGADPASLSPRFHDFMVKYTGAEPRNEIDLQPVGDIRLKSSLRGELEPGGSMEFVYLFSAIGLFILLLACVNFMNLATARASKRAREVGVRKAIGAERRQLIGQFLSESTLLAAAAALVGVCISAASLPVLNTLAGKSIPVAALFDVRVLFLLVGLAAATGLAAGAYPALFLASFRPSVVLKGSGVSGRGETFRRALVVFQFFVGIVLLSGTLIVRSQMDVVRSMYLGFDRETVLVAPLSDPIRDRADAVKERLLSDPSILAATLTQQVPARAGSGGQYDIEGVDERHSLYRFLADGDFTETYGTHIVAGRDLSSESEADRDHGFLVNEAFVQSFGFTNDEVVGKSITQLYAGTTREGTIVGVVRDFNIFSLRESIPEVVIAPMPAEYYRYLSIRTAPADAGRAIDHTAAVWGEFSPAYPFEYFFLDDDFARLHASEQNLASVFRAFSLLAILIACLGLFGLAAFVCEFRRKEVGIRKALGASVQSILLLLTREFVLLVLAATALAAPVMWFAMRSWLQQFAYGTPLTLWPILGAGAAALFVALATVSVQYARAAMANPVSALREN